MGLGMVQSACKIDRERSRREPRRGTLRRRRMKKRFLSGLLAAVMALAMLPEAARAESLEVASGSCGENVTWRLDSEGTMTISGQGPMTDYELVAGDTVHAPWTAPDPDNSLASKIKTVHILAGVTSVGNYAFVDCFSLEDVILPSTITRIGKNAFEDSIKLSAITLSYGLQVIDSYAFAGSGITAVSIPATVIQMGHNVFQSCYQLRTATFQNGAADMGSNTFFNCRNLVEVNLAPSIEVIGDGAFWNCAALESLKIPEGVKEISNLAFWECPKLTTLYLPRSLTRMGDGISIFLGEVPLKDIYYAGSAAAWERIEKSDRNDMEIFNQATIHYGDDTPLIEVELISRSPAVLEEIPYRASYLELDLVFSHEIEGFDFSKGTLHIYDQSSGREIYALRRNGMSSDPNQPSGDASLSYPTSHTLSIKTISNNLDLSPMTWYYVTLDDGFLRFKETDQSYKITDPAEWSFMIGDKRDKYPVAWRDGCEPIEAVLDNDSLVMSMTALSKLSYSTFGSQYYGETVESFVNDQKNMEWTNKGGDVIWTVDGKGLGSYAAFYRDIVGRYTVYDDFDDNRTSGFYGVCFRSPDGKYIISYRGSQGLDIGAVIAHLFINPSFGSDNDWSTDMDFALRNILGDQFKYALQFYNEIAREVGEENIVLTGHSLGGSLAAYVSICTGARAYPIDGAVGHIVDTAFWQSFTDIRAFRGVDAFNFVNLTDEVGVSWGGDLIQAEKRSYYPMVTYRSLHPRDSNDLSDFEKECAGSHHQLSFLTCDPSGEGRYEMGDMVRTYTCNARWSNDILDYVAMLKGAAAHMLKGNLAGVAISVAGDWIFDRGRVQLGTTGNDRISAPSMLTDSFVSNHQFGGGGSDCLSGYAVSDIVVPGPGGPNILEGQGGSDIYLIDEDCGSTVIFDCAGLDVIFLRNWNKNSITAGSDPQEPSAIRITDGIRSIGVSRFRNAWSPCPVVVAWANEDCTQTEVIYKDLMRDVPKPRAAAAPADMDAQAARSAGLDATRLVLVEGTSTVEIYDEGGNLLTTDGGFSNTADNTQHTEYGYYYGYQAAAGEAAYALLYLFNEGCTVKVRSDEPVSAAVCQYDSSESSLISEQRTEGVLLSDAALALVSAGADKGFYLVGDDGALAPVENVATTFYAQTVALSQSSLSLRTGAAARLTVSVAPAEAGTDGNWISSNPTVAKVDEHGTVTACGEGAAEITFFSANGRSASCQISVISGSAPDPILPDEGGTPFIPGGSVYPDAAAGAVSYRVSVPSRVNGGRVAASPATAAKGTAVTLTVIPDSGYELRDLTVIDHKSRQVSLTSAGDGTYTFTMPDGAVTVDAVFAPVRPAEAVWSSPYSDIARESWYYDAVRFVSENGIMNGTSANLFSPDSATTRGMVVAILYRLNGEPAAGVSAFTDVPAGQWYTAAVSWAAANGIVDGYGDGRFGPNDIVTREQLAAILYRYTAFEGGDVGAKADISAYCDGEAIRPYALEPMRWAVAEGIINGFDDGYLAPGKSTSRAQAAQILKNYINRPGL